MPTLFAGRLASAGDQAQLVHQTIRPSEDLTRGQFTPLRPSAVIASHHRVLSLSTSSLR